MKYLALIISLTLLASCSGHSQPYQRASLQRETDVLGNELKETDILSPQYTRDLITGAQQAPNAQVAKQQINTQLGKWFYGHGFGRSALNIGTIVVFPPYALYLLGNAGIELAGYDPLYITNVFPEEPRKGILDLYDGITSIPGRVNATIADKNFVDTPSVKRTVNKPAYEQRAQNSYSR